MDFTWLGSQAQPIIISFSPPKGFITDRNTPQSVIKNKFLFTMTAYREQLPCSGAEWQIFTSSARGFDPATFQLLAQRAKHQDTCRPIV